MVLCQVCGVRETVPYRLPFFCFESTRFGSSGGVAFIPGLRRVFGIMGEAFLCVGLIVTLFFILPISRTGRGAFAIIVSTKRKKGSPNTHNSSVGRGTVGLTMTLELNDLVSRGRSSIGIVCAHGASIFVRLSRETGVTGQGGTSLFVSVRAGTIGENDSMSKARACALNLTHASRGLRITVHRGSTVLLRSGCLRGCRNFSPASSRSCVVFRFVRGGRVRRDVDLTSRIRGYFTSTGHGGEKIQRTNFLILHGADVPDVLIRLKCVSGPTRRHFVEAGRKRGGLTATVCGTFAGCG